MVFLHNQQLTASIHPKGAELQSLQYNNLEYMWRGDAAYWGKYSPILFPIVGSLKDDTYYYNQQTWHLPRHGFAREKIFEVDQISDTEAIFSLTENADTLQVYPFHFLLQIHYTIIENKLVCTYRVKNTGQESMLFSIGGHPAFACPLVNGSNYTDHYLSFNNQEALYRYKLDNGLISMHKEMLYTYSNDTNTQQLPLSPALFYEDAIVLKNISSTAVTLAASTHTRKLVFDISAFPYLGIWAAKDAPFVCIEPWSGIADSTNHNQELEKKEGIIQLSSGTPWQKSWSVSLF